MLLVAPEGKVVQFDGPDPNANATETYFVGDLRVIEEQKNLGDCGGEVDLQRNENGRYHGLSKQLLVQICFGRGDTDRIAFEFTANTKPDHPMFASPGVGHVKAFTLQLDGFDEEAWNDVMTVWSAQQQHSMVIFSEKFKVRSGPAPAAFSLEMGWLPKTCRCFEDSDSLLLDAGSDPKKWANAYKVLAPKHCPPMDCWIQFTVDHDHDMDILIDRSKANYDEKVDLRMTMMPGSPIVDVTERILHPDRIGMGYWESSQNAEHYKLAKRLYLHVSSVKTVVEAEDSSGVLEHLYVKVMAKPSEYCDMLDCFFVFRAAPGAPGFKINGSEIKLERDGDLLLTGTLCGAVFPAYVGYRHWRSEASIPFLTPIISRFRRNDERVDIVRPTINPNEYLVDVR
ncbi:unnamed protein product, partial [Mesorhabditis spiculigera]